MRILVAPTFARAVKKLPPAQKTQLDDAVRTIVERPDIGDAKVGDLAGVRVFKFRMESHLWLLAYSVGEDAITLLALGSHQNFYRDLKR